MKHIVLLGDSIFDNKNKCVEGGKDTITNLRERMPDDWKASLLAVDDSVSDDVAHQLTNGAGDATHIFVSVGRNDAFNELDILDISASSDVDMLNALSNRVGAHVLNALSDKVRAFEWRYSQMLDDVLALDKPTVVCTTYVERYDQLKFGDAAWLKLQVRPTVRIVIMPVVHQVRRL